MAVVTTRKDTVISSSETEMAIFRSRFQTANDTTSFETTWKRVLVVQGLIFSEAGRVVVVLRISRWAK